MQPILPASFQESESSTAARVGFIAWLAAQRPTLKGCEVTCSDDDFAIDCVRRRQWQEKGNAASFVVKISYRQYFSTKTVFAFDSIHTTRVFQGHE